MPLPDKSEPRRPFYRREQESVLKPTTFNFERLGPAQEQLNMYSSQYDVRGMSLPAAFINMVTKLRESPDCDRVFLPETSTYLKEQA